MFLLYALDRGLVVLIQETADVSRHLAKKRRLRFKIQTNNIEFLKTLQTPSGRTNVVVNEVALLDQLQICPDQKLTDVS